MRMNSRSDAAGISSAFFNIFRNEPSHSNPTRNLRYLLATNSRLAICDDDLSLLYARPAYSLFKSKTTM